MLLGLSQAIGDVGVLAAGRGAAPSPALAVSRPPVALTRFWNLWGDSTTAGVGAAVASSYPAQIRSAATGLSGQSFHGGTGAGDNGAAVAIVGNGGKGGDTTAQIAARVAAAKAGYPAEMDRPQVFAGGLNDFLYTVSP